MSYNPNNFHHILVRASEVISIGKIKACHINMPAEYELNENLLFQIGEAEGKKLESLLAYADNLAAELSTSY